MLIPPRKLLISGGGVRVTAHVGALRLLEDKGYLKFIREYIGVSAGAWLCTMLVLGYTLEQVKELVMGLDFSIVRSQDAEFPVDFFETFGCDNGENLDKLLISIFRVKGHNPDLTFADLQKQGLLGLRIFATDLNTRTLKEFSLKRTPDYSVRKALLASMSLPLYFHPVKDEITGHLLTDGGVISNYPIQYLKEHEIEECFGLTFKNPKEQVPDIANFSDFVSQLIGSFCVLRDSKAYELYKSRTLVIDCGDYPAWNFEASLEDRKYLYKYGIDAAESFLRTKPIKHQGLRRYSVS